MVNNVGQANDYQSENYYWTKTREEQDVERNEHLKDNVDHRDHDHDHDRHRCIDANECVA